MQLTGIGNLSHRRLPMDKSLAPVRLGINHWQLPKTVGKKMTRPFRFSGRIRSFRYAAKGILITLRSQHNAWIHAAATFAVVALGLMLGITRIEWCLVILACAAVWTAEALNTAFEFLCDATTREFHAVVAQAKDVAAGAVLLTAIGAVIIGILVLGPYALSSLSAM
jgi:diacylglycerol kinase (ATP)